MNRPTVMKVQFSDDCQLSTTPTTPKANNVVPIQTESLAMVSYFPPSARSSAERSIAAPKSRENEPTVGVAISRSDPVTIMMSAHIHSVRVLRSVHPAAWTALCAMRIE
jgi:hypothetical protein